MFGAKVYVICISWNFSVRIAHIVSTFVVMCLNECVIYIIRLEMAIIHNLQTHSTYVHTRARKWRFHSFLLFSFSCILLLFFCYFSNKHLSFCLSFHFRHSSLFFSDKIKNKFEHILTKLGFFVRLHFSLSLYFSSFEIFCQLVFVFQFRNEQFKILLLFFLLTSCAMRCLLFLFSCVAFFFLCYCSFTPISTKSNAMTHKMHNSTI